MYRQNPHFFREVLLLPMVCTKFYIITVQIARDFYILNITSTVSSFIVIFSTTCCRNSLRSGRLFLLCIYFTNISFNPKTSSNVGMDVHSSCNRFNFLSIRAFYISNSSIRSSSLSATVFVHPFSICNTQFFYFSFICFLYRFLCFDFFVL